MMKYFTLFFCLNLYLISIMPITVNAEDPPYNSLVVTPGIIMPITGSVEDFSYTHIFIPFSLDLLCDGSFLASLTTTEGIFDLFRFIRENDNRSLVGKLTIDPVSAALRQDCGEGNTPLYIAVQFRASFDVISLLIRAEPNNLRRRNNNRSTRSGNYLAGQTPAMILRDRLTRSGLVTDEGLDILLLLEQ